MKDKDSEYMRLALELAQKGYGYVAPNPLVGAVVIKEDRAGMNVSDSRMRSAMRWRLV